MTDQYAELRDPDNFRFVALAYPYGERIGAIPLINNIELQKSRGLVFDEDTTNFDIDVMLATSRTSNQTKHIDVFRIAELCTAVGLGVIKIGEAGFYELGFRCTKLMDGYASWFKRAAGCDVVPLNVEIAKHAGYNNCEVIDLNERVPDLSQYSFIVCYHVLEHITDPLATLVSLYASMTPGTVFHVEVPIESDGPRVRYGHLHAFHSGDLSQALEHAGFSIVYMSTIAYDETTPIERAIAVKH